MVYWGQVDEDEEPNGVGRLLKKDGSIFEGYMIINPTVLPDLNSKVIPEGFVRKIEFSQEAGNSTETFTWYQNSL